jgi:nucleoside-diphosphate-sugar epimerase
VTPTKVLITGVYGLIGNVVYATLAQHSDTYTVYGLARRRHPSQRIAASHLLEIPDWNFFLADLADFYALQTAVEGMDVVVHMAANADSTAGWDSILSNNIIGTYHVFEACRLAGVKRIIFASSIMVNSGYKAEEPYRSIYQKRHADLPPQIPLVTHEMPTRPLHMYSSSKVWGEALAHLYAYTHGISCLCLRIGWVADPDRPPEPSGRFEWCSQRDIAQLVECCINAPQTVRFDIFYGVSDNPYRWVDIAHARQVVGWVPQDRSEAYVQEGKTSGDR